MNGVDYNETSLLIMRKYRDNFRCSVIATKTSLISASILMDESAVGILSKPNHRLKIIFS